MNRFGFKDGMAATMAGLLLCSCATTDIVSQWKKPGPAGSACTNVLVIGISGQESVRRNFEDGFAKQLAAMGVGAVCGYTLIPDSGKADRAAIAKAVASSGADGVLVVRLVRVAQKVAVAPGEELPLTPDDLYGYYDWAWGEYYEPPTVYSYDVVDMETKLFHAANQDLLWALSTESLYPSDLEKGIASFSKTVLGTARKDGLL